jgi:outer membrane protein TolC
MLDFKLIRKFLITCVLGATTGCVPLFNNLKTETQDNLLLDAENEIAEAIDAKRQKISPPKNVKFQSAMIKNVLAAVKKDPNYTLAVISEAEALSMVSVAESGAKPQISSTAVLGEVAEFSSPTIRSQGARLGLTLSQLIFDGGATASSIELEKINYLTAVSQTKNTANELTLQLATEIVRYSSANQRRNLLEKKIDLLDSMVTQMSKMVSNGLIDKSSLDAAYNQVSEFDIELTKMTLEKEMLEISIRKSFTGPPKSLFYDLKSLSFLETWPVGAWSDDLLLHQSALSVLKAEKNLLKAKAQNKPTFSFEAGASSPLEKNKDSSLNVGLRANYIFGDGGRRAATIDAAIKRYEVSKKSLAATKEKSELKFRTAVQRFESAKETRALTNEKINLLVNELQTANAQLSTGRSQFSQILDMEIALYRTEDQQLKNLAEIYEVRLLMAQISDKLIVLN